MVSLESQSPLFSNNGEVTAISYSDKAKRFADIVNGFTTWVPWEDRKRYWLAIRISDGGCDGVLYESRLDAVTHQAYEKQCVYFSFVNCMAGISVREADAFLRYHELLYKNGARFPDPDRPNGGPDHILTVSNYDTIRKVANAYLYESMDRKARR